MKRIRVKTLDDINLVGFLYEGLSNVWNIIIPGVDGNIMTNDFLDVLGNVLSNNNQNFILGHHRGSFQIISSNSIDSTIKGKTIGSVFEKFDDCIYDINSWIEYAINNGAKKINLLGHSHGCNKLIFYLNKEYKYNSYINKIIFISPLDLFTRMNTRSELSVLYDKIKFMEENGFNDFLCCGFFYKSVDSFKDMMKNNNINNFPMLSDVNNDFKLFNLIKNDKYVIYGSLENRYVKNFDKKLPMLKNLNEFLIIDGASHIYQGKEDILAKNILRIVKEDV